MPLFRRRRNDPPPLEEADVYAHSYGERSDDVTNVQPVPHEEPAPALDEAGERGHLLGEERLRGTDERHHGGVVRDLGG